MPRAARDRRAIGSPRWRAVALALCCASATAASDTTAPRPDGERTNLRDNSFFIEEAYNQEPGVAQHIFSWITLWRVDGGRSGLFTFAYSLELPILSENHQFSLVVPTFDRFAERDERAVVGEGAGGIGDLIVSYRYQLVRDAGARPAVAPRVALILPTGNRDRRLGLGTVGYGFNLPISKEVEPFAFHLNAGYTFVPDLTVPLAAGLEAPGRDLHVYNFGLGVVWLATIDLNPFVEVVALIDDGLDERGRPEQTTQVLANPGVRYALYTDDRVQWVVGLSLPVGLTRDAPRIGLFGYMSVEHSL